MQLLEFLRILFLALIYTTTHSSLPTAIPGYPLSVLPVLPCIAACSALLPERMIENHERGVRNGHQLYTGPGGMHTRA
jgi:hypothetical protein